MMQDNYYQRNEVSNSDLTWMEKYWMPQSFVIDLEKAYRFGTLLDCMITEPHKIDFFKLKIGAEQYTKEEFEQAKQMKKSFMADPFCKQLLAMATMQKVSIKRKFPINYNGLIIHLDARAKWDFFVTQIDMSGDLKSTACTTQKQFEESIYHFNYDRQAAWYMDLEGRNNFMFIGVSKVNYKVFKVPVKKGGSLYESGKRKYEDLAFRWWYLFADVNQAA